MTQTPEQRETAHNVTMPMARLVALVTGAWALSAVGASAVAQFASQRGAWIGAIAALVGVGAGLMIVAVSPARPAAQWSMVQVLSSATRMLLALAVGVGLYLAARPDKGGFFGVLLATLLATLAAEVMVFLPVIRGHARAGDGVAEAAA